jgi:hypothetical protein
MTPQEHQAISDLAELRIHEYFDHYLTNVFPGQVGRIMEAHNADVNAHPTQFKTLASVKRKVDRTGWMLAGMSALAGAIGSLAAFLYYIVGIKKP